MTEIQMTRTSLGFSIAKFSDFNGVPCSIQKSSIATEDCIWLGALDIGLKRFSPAAGGWSDVPLEKVVGGVQHVANNRMHLTREQVKDLLPLLQHFAETGELPDA